MDNLYALSWICSTLEKFRLNTLRCSRLNFLAIRNSLRSFRTQIRFVRGIKWLLRALPALLRVLPLLCNTDSVTLSSFQLPPSITERIINVGETITRRALFEDTKYPSLRALGRTVQLINERSSAREVLCGTFLPVRGSTNN